VLAYQLDVGGWRCPWPVDLECIIQCAKLLGGESMCIVGRFVWENVHGLQVVGS
jgi:hypothetical protein